MVSSTPKGYKEFCENPIWDTDNDRFDRFDRELLANLLVLDWVVFESFIILEAVCGFENVRRKVRVLSIL